MNINKLNIQPSDIDKNTGRIILPSSEELEKMSPGAKTAPQAGKTLPIPRSAKLSDIRKTTANSHTRSYDNSVHTELANTKSRAPKSYINREPFLPQPLLTVLALTLIILPLGIISVFFMNKNMQLKNDLNQAHNQLASQEVRNNSLLRSLLNERTVEKNDLTSIRGDIRKISQSQNQLQEAQTIQVSQIIEGIIEETTVNETATLEQEALEASIEAFIYKDEKGNIIPEEEVIAGEYVIQE